VTAALDACGLFTPPEKPNDSDDPERSREDVHGEGLIDQEGNWTAGDVASAGAHVGHQLQERPVMVDVPQNVGEPDEHGDGEADPNPALKKGAAFAGEDKSNDNAGAKEEHGPFVQDAHAGNHAKP